MDKEYVSIDRDELKRLQADSADLATLRKSYGELLRVSRKVTAEVAVTGGAWKRFCEFVWRDDSAAQQEGQQNG